MEGIDVVVVDDSPFSVTFISEILAENGFNVVGSADSLESVVEVVKEKKPNLVTMDMTMPGTDGFECTRAIHAIDKSIKVIMVSSMMDDEIVRIAKLNRISAFIQKPIDGDELLNAINHILAEKEVFSLLQDIYFTVFKDSLRDSLNKMTKTVLTYEKEYIFEEPFTSEGVSIVIGISGGFSGKMIISISNVAAKVLTASILKREPKDDNEVTTMLAEFANIVSGNACSILNRNNEEFSLRVSPPSIATGENIQISPPDYETFMAEGSCVFGKILINVGFKKG